MSRHVIGYTGEGRARRPIYADEGPSSAVALGDPVAAVGRLSTDSLIPQGGAGPVERRRVSEAQRAAWRERATEVEDAPLRVDEDPEPDPEPQPQPREEPAMSADNDDPYAELAEAASEASEARQGLATAQERWDAAERRLQEIWARTNGPAAVEPEPERPVVLHHRAQPKRHRPGGAQERAKSVEARGQRVLEVLARHNGNTKAAGDELGMRGNVVARIAKAARDRQAKAS